MAKLTRKGAVRKLDSLCKEIVHIRDKDTCRKCGIFVSEFGGNVHHIIPKKRGYHVRWDINNLILLCATCHFWWHKDPTAILWLRDNDPFVFEVIQEINKGETESYKLRDLLEIIVTLTKFRDLILEK